MITGKQYAEKVLEVYNLKPKAGYIWGKAGITWTAKAQENMNKTTESKYAQARKYGSKWIGHKVWDCSGLTSERGKQFGLSFHHGSNSSWKYDCAYKGVLTDDMELPEGAWVYTGTDSDKPHIGTYTGDGKVTEAAGTYQGVIQTKLHGGKWKYWGLGKGITFDFIPGQEKPPEVVKPPEKKTEPVVVTYPTIKKGSRGELVVQLQLLLSRAGWNLKVDGIFGVKTKAAVKEFQEQHNLVVDGIVGPKTWGELVKIK